MTRAPDSYDREQSSQRQLDEDRSHERDWERELHQRPPFPPTRADMLERSAMLAANCNSNVREAERTLEFYLLFDALAGFPRSITTLFELATPGATEALRTWAAAAGYWSIDLLIPDAPEPTRVLRVECPGGADLTVQRPA